MTSVAALLLADGRFPAGGHAHSGGLEEAVADGRVHDLATLESFLRGRLATTGLVAAGLAAAACLSPASVPELDAEAGARIPSPALREASRRQGRQLVRAAAHSWALPEAVPDSPHHPVAVGAVAAAAGLPADAAARWAAYESVMTPAGAGVRLLSLDPFAVTAVVAALAGEVEEVAARGAAAATAACAAGGSLADLPCPSAPALDLGAEAHCRREVRLFAS